MAKLTGSKRTAGAEGLELDSAGHVRYRSAKCEEQTRRDPGKGGMLSGVCGGQSDPKRLINQLFKVYFRINKLNLCKPLIRAIESSNFKESFSLITYKYLAMFDSYYRNADEYLSFAFENCPKRFARN